MYTAVYTPSQTLFLNLLIFSVVQVFFQCSSNPVKHYMLLFSELILTKLCHPYLSF